MKKIIILAALVIFASCATQRKCDCSTKIEHEHWATQYQDGKLTAWEYYDLLAADSELNSLNHIK